MALNKSMHARNSLNFKDPEALRALTCTLLKEDFGLTIDIPVERLIPTVPLRLNYIHWVEDLIAQQEVAKQAPIWGIDIGTGASCIYPLLGATLNGWFFLATEVDDMCFNYAKKNVEQNNLSDLIKVVKVPQKTLLMDALKEESEIIYDFCMCNPPFFANQLEAKGVNSRNPRRPPPSSVNTGGITEIMAEGGELEFVKRIIHDSLQLKKRLRWYSCMLGKKCSLAPLKEELRIQGVPKVTHTEFCQGRTMRWALAWSFYDDVQVPSPPSKRRKLEKPRKPITFIVLESTAKELSVKASAAGLDAGEGIAVVAAWAEKILTNLKVQHKRVPCGEDEVGLFLTAIENSWIHLRRKKRERVRQLRELPRASEETLQAMEEARADRKEPSNNPDSERKKADITEMGSTASLDEDPQSDNEDWLKQEPPGKEESNQGLVEEQGVKAKAVKTAAAGCEDSCKAAEEANTLEGVNSLTIETGQNPKAQRGRFLFKCLLNVKKEGDDSLVEMHWVEGQNRDLMNQLCTYLKNQMFRLVAI
uniref:U6 small nuclear RNA (adenine-(43)-N(6))-methyltransferase n=1 Tax=Sphenodon punctatus TaxID=8508 RepID=A0A8D0GHN9_SPHPU